jgi:hypothetical protein
MDDENNQQLKRAPAPRGPSQPKKKLRLRHDGFTPKKQRKFIRIITKTGCVRDACRGVGISSNTAYRTREKLPDLAQAWESALKRASTSLEAVAWKRGVEGVEEPVYHQGKFSHMAVKRSDSILRLLMIGSDKKKYGRMGAVGQAKIGDDERERIRREAKQELRAKLKDKQGMDDVRAEVLRLLEGLNKRLVSESGYTRLPNGSLIPPGWRAERIDGSERVGLWDDPEVTRELPSPGSPDPQLLHCAPRPVSNGDERAPAAGLLPLQH